MTTHMETVHVPAPRLRGLALAEAPEHELRPALTVLVRAEDELSRAGIEQFLGGCPDVWVVPDGAADVVLLMTERVDELTLVEVRSLRAQGCRVVLVLQVLDDPALLAAVEAGASALLLRSQASPAVLEKSVRSAAVGDGNLPPDLLGRLMAQVQAVQQEVLTPRGLTWGALSARETDVLRLIADGHDTAAVAQALCWSERTVKNVVHDITTRLNLRNRAHAVAYAVRHGLI